MRFWTRNERRPLWSWGGMIATVMVATFWGSAGLAVEPGRIVAWGWDDCGQVSDTPSGNGFVAVSGGFKEHTLALNMDGSIVSWGRDNYGQVSNTPNGNDFVAVSCGGYFSVALKNDGSLVCWGQDTLGQVTDTPTGTDFVAIAAGLNHSVALKSDGSIVSWGYDSSGQVSDTPAGPDFQSVAAGGSHNVALKNDGSLLSWGDDMYGQVTDTPGGTGFVAVACGGLHSVALKTDGSLVSWGDDTYGQVSDTPVGTGFKTLAAGFYHGVAINSDRSLVSWGWDSYGQVTDTPGGTGFVAVDGGQGHGVALMEPTVPEFVHYQGHLNDSLGDPLDGVVDLTLRLYDDAFAGNLLLTSQHTGVQVTEGLFNLLIGSSTVTPGTESTLGDVFENHTGVWISIEVENDGETMPRKLIASVGYASRTGSAANLTQVVPRSTAPANPSKGAVYMDDTTNKLMVYDGTTWQACW